MKIAELDAGASGFEAALEALLAWGGDEPRGIEAAVAEILDDVRRRGDAAVLEYTRRFDRLGAATVGELRLDRKALDAALHEIGQAERAALEYAAERIRAYHEHQGFAEFAFQDAHGNTLGQRVTALDAVGFYVPGGQASYPSSVLMSVIPAQVAGVERLVMVVPTPDGVRDPLVLAAASLAGVDEVFCIGGAQAIAALAFGTESVPRVDKIVGPGGAYVAAAKRQVFGRVGIDIVAGPSEIVVVSDASVDPRWLAMDLASQAEHDADAQAILLTPDAAHLAAVREALSGIAASMQRSNIIQASLAGRGALILTRDLDEALRLANRIAPEHLELAVAEPDAALERVRHAGAVFLGSHTAEVLGDYVAGPSHVLPTFGTARFSSPLSVYDFQKRTSIIRCSTSGAGVLGRQAARLARSEGLTAHARSAELRVPDDDV